MIGVKPNVKLQQLIRARKWTAAYAISDALNLAMES